MLSMVEMMTMTATLTMMNVNGNADSCDTTHNDGNNATDDNAD